MKDTRNQPGIQSVFFSFALTLYTICQMGFLYTELKLTH